MVSLSGQQQVKIFQLRGLGSMPSGLRSLHWLASVIHFPRKNPQQTLMGFRLEEPNPGQVEDARWAILSFPVTCTLVVWPIRLFALQVWLSPGLFGKPTPAPRDLGDCPFPVIMFAIKFKQAHKTKGKPISSASSAQEEARAELHQV